MVAVLALHGCSYLMIDRPPRAVRKGDTFPACTEDNTFPWIDLGATAFAAVGAVVIYSGVAKADTDDPMVKRELTTNEKFDAITADPFDVWVKGSANLNTLEFYQEMKKHLNPGGVVTAWVAFYETDSASFKSEVATFMKVFPYSMVFGNLSSGQGYDGVLVGSAEPLTIDVSAIEAKLHQPRYAPVLKSLQDVNYSTAVSLFGTFAAHSSQLANYLSDAQINRDRNLRLQYLAGMAVNHYEQSQLYSDLKSNGGWKDGLFSGDPDTLAELRLVIGEGVAQ